MGEYMKRLTRDYRVEVPLRFLGSGASPFTVSEDARESRRRPPADLERARSSVSDSPLSASPDSSGIFRAWAKKSLASRSQIF